MPIRRNPKSRPAKRSVKKSTKRHARRVVSKVALGGVSKRSYGDKISFTDTRGLRVAGIPVTISTALSPPSLGIPYGLIDTSITPSSHGSITFTSTAQGQNDGTRLIPPALGVGPYAAYPYGAGFAMGERLDDTMYNSAATIQNRWDQYRVDSVDYTVTFDGQTVAIGNEGIDMEKVTLYMVPDHDDIVPPTAISLVMERPGFRMYTFDKNHRTFTFSYKPQYQSTGSGSPGIEQQVSGGWFDTLAGNLTFLGVKFYCLYDLPLNSTSASEGSQLSQNKVFTIDRVYHLSVRGYK